MSKDAAVSAAPETGTRLFILDFHERGSVELKLTFSPAEITAAVNHRPGCAPPRRAERRSFQRWSKHILKPLDRDHRPLRWVTTAGGQVQSVGFEFAGQVQAYFPAE